MGRQERKPFDPGDPFDAMAESIRRQVTDIPLEMMRASLYRDLPPHKQAECLIAGLLTGTIGVLFAYIHPDGRDALMEAVVDYLPDARKVVEGMLDSIDSGRDG